MRIVLLLSGGVESSTLLRRQVETDEVLPLFLDYGQRASAPEWTAARTQCAQMGATPERLNLAAVGDTFRARSEKKYHVPLPHRNLVALSLATSFAAHSSAGAIAIALTQDDARDYVSAGPDFCRLFAGLADAVGGIRLLTPFADMSKSDVVREGVALRVKFETTYSCLLGYNRHCGRCPQCAKRQAAFRAAGVAEADGFYGVDPREDDD